MDKGDHCVYLCKMLIYEKMLNPLPPDFGLKSDWCRYLEEHKFNDKSLTDYIDWMIDVGILIEFGRKNSQFIIYRPDEKGKEKAQKLLEQNTIFMWIDSIYDIERNPKKGSLNL